MKDVKFTQLEQEVLDALIGNLYAEAGFSDVDAHDIAKQINKSTKVVRGALSSLVKKKVIQLQATDNCFADEQYVIIYLNEAFYYLHPEWSKELEA